MAKHTLNQSLKESTNLRVILNSLLQPMEFVTVLNFNFQSMGSTAWSYFPPRTQMDGIIWK